MTADWPCWFPCEHGAPDDPRCNGEFALLKALAPELRRVVDVGANVGDWTAEVLLVDPGAELLAIEPQPILVQRLRHRFAGMAAEHGGASVTVYQVALGSHGPSREATMYVYHGAKSGMSGLVRRPCIGAPDTLRIVEVVSLDETMGWFRWESIDLVKIDTEGSEMAVLRGARTLLASGAVRFWQLEYGGCWRDAGERLADCVTLLEAAGYELGTITPTGVVPGVGVEDYQYRNLFARRRA